MRSWIVEDWKRQYKMLMKLSHPFYGHLCTLSAQIIVIHQLYYNNTYGNITFSTQYYEYASASCCLNTNGCNDCHFMGLWLLSLCTFFALSVADIQSLSHALAYLYKYS